MTAWTDADLEFVPCDACGGAELRHLCLRPDGLNVYECAACGLGFVNPRPRAEAIHRIYRKGYFDSSRPGIGYKNYEPPRHFPELDVVERHAPLRGRTVLEIGCATGALLCDARRRGALINGIEPNLAAAAVAEQRLGIKIHATTLEQIPPADLGSPDVIVAFEVIEHLTSPGRFLDRLRQSIRPGGHLVLTTPNLACAGEYGGSWRGFQHSFEHLYFLSASSLSQMARQAGFTEEAWYTRGTGEPMPATPGRLSLARRLAHRLTRVRTIAKWNYRLRGPVFAPGGRGHTLLAIYRAGRAR